MNAEPSADGGSGIRVGDTELSGWMWSENTGWISLSCKNTLTCSAVDYGVLNDGNGTLSGYAWGENVGWVNFRWDTGSPGDGAVVTDFVLGGYVYGANTGWINLGDGAPANGIQYGNAAAGDR